MRAGRGSTDGSVGVRDCGERLDKPPRGPELLLAPPCRGFSRLRPVPVLLSALTAELLPAGTASVSPAASQESTGPGVRASGKPQQFRNHRRSVVLLKHYKNKKKLVTLHIDKLVF